VRTEILTEFWWGEIKCRDQFIWNLWWAKWQSVGSLLHYFVLCTVNIFLTSTLYHAATAAFLNNTLFSISEEKHLGRPRRRWEAIIEIASKEIGWERPGLD
jgi:hypothetical protein